jgi:hypothetical protein
MERSSRRLGDPYRSAMEQMKFTTDDVVTDDHEGLIEVSFGARNGMFFQLARLSEKCCQTEGSLIVEWRTFTSS